MDKSPGFMPKAEDTRYDLRLKLRVAQAHLRLADSNVYDHALAAVAEIALGRTMAGEPIKVHPRTRVQAARALMASAASVFPQQPAVQVNNQAIVSVGIDREAYRIGARSEVVRRAAAALLNAYVADEPPPEA